MQKLSQISEYWNAVMSPCEEDGVWIVSLEMRELQRG
jgi:hypothetical protein